MASPQKHWIDTERHVGQRDEMYRVSRGRYTLKDKVLLGCILGSEGLGDVQYDPEYRVYCKIPGACTYREYSTVVAVGRFPNNQSNFSVVQPTIQYGPTTKRNVTKLRFHVSFAWGCLRDQQRLFPRLLALKQIVGRPYTVRQLKPTTTYHHIANSKPAA